MIRHLAGHEGIRQFLDIGTGLPAAENTHEVAQRVAPQSRIVSVDNDPLVPVHARAFLTSAPEGACDYVEGDLRDPEQILAEAAATLDFGKPVALLLFGVLHHVPTLRTEQRNGAGRLNAAADLLTRDCGVSRDDLVGIYLHCGSGGVIDVRGARRALLRW